MRAMALVTVLIALCGTTWPQKVKFDPMNRADVLSRMQDAPENDVDRAASIKAMFANSGCSGKHLREQAVDGALGPNIVCELAGEGPETVIVGAHYDRVSSAVHFVDNWSAASLLPAIYHGMRKHARRHNFIFVAFADHESNVSGADFFVSHLDSSDLSHIEAMVNLDALGLSPTKVWSSRSSKELVQDLLTMVYSMKLPASQIDLESGSTDADPFARRQIPSITIHSLTRENLDGKTVTPFRPDNYYDSYRLLCAYLAYLDVALKARPHS